MRAAGAAGGGAAANRMNGEDAVVTNVFIIAGSPVLRAGLEAILRNDERLSAAGDASEISDAPLNFSPEKNIDVLLVSAEREKEFAALSEFLRDAAAADSVANSAFVVALLAPDLQDAEQALELLQTGARGILPHDSSAEEIRAAIIAAANDLAVIAPEFLEALLASGSIENFTPGEKDESADAELRENLTTREREVLDMLAEGASNKTIALQLNISEHTVKFHVASIFGKLDASTRTEAVTVALRRGLILL